MRDLVMRCAVLVALAGCQTSEPSTVATAPAEPAPPAVPEWALEQCAELAWPWVKEQIGEPLGSVVCGTDTGQVYAITASRPRDYWGDVYSGGVFLISHGFACVRVTPGASAGRWNECRPLNPPPSSAAPYITNGGRAVSRASAERALAQCSDLARTWAEQTASHPVIDVICDYETGQVAFTTETDQQDRYQHFLFGGAWSVANGTVCVRVTPGLSATGTLDRWDDCEPLAPPGEPVG